MSVATCGLEFLTLREISELGLGSVETLRARIKSGEIAAYDFGGFYKIRRYDLDAFLAAHRCPAKSDSFDDFVESILAVAPALNDDQRARIMHLVGGAAA